MYMNIIRTIKILVNVSDTFYKLQKKVLHHFIYDSRTASTKHIINLNFQGSILIMPYFPGRSMTVICDIEIKVINFKDFPNICLFTKVHLKICMA